MITWLLEHEFTWINVASADGPEGYEWSHIVYVS